MQYLVVFMGKEIERKYLVRSDLFKPMATRVTYYRQGYIPTVNGMTVRVRIAGDIGYVTFKDHAIGFTRHEFEYEIPKEDAIQMLDLMCEKPQIEKHRYVVPATQPSASSASSDVSSDTTELKWEVDVFHGDNEGLVIAEIEVPSEETQFDLPAWIGEEVTGDKKYYNSHLCFKPFKTWAEK